MGVITTISMGEIIGEVLAERIAEVASSSGRDSVSVIRELLSMALNIYDRERLTVEMIRSIAAAPIR